MSQNGKRTAQKRRFNKKTYVTYLFRVRAESDLADRLGGYSASGETSVNFLITDLLCAYFGVELPHKHYDEIERAPIWPPPFI